MDVKAAIDKRKSIRKWLDKPIPEYIINELLDAARRAPSAKNVQSHRYYVIKTKDIINKLRDKGAFKQPYVYEAPLIIVCCANPRLYPESTDVDLPPEHYAMIDLAIATSFLTLRATELGLGCVFVAWIYRDKIKEVLGIPKEYIIPFVIPIGYPAEDPIRKGRKDLKDIMF
jgi:nitroreductase